MEQEYKEILMRYRIDTERVDLFDVNIVITMKVSLDSGISFEDAQRAFYKACSLHEVLNSKVVIEDSGEAFYVDNDEPQNSISITSLSLEELICENERKRFKIDQGEFIRAFVSSEGLIFMMHHLGGDGKSLLYFIETFMKCLSGGECGYLPFRSLGLADLPKESKLPFYYELLSRSWNKKWQKDRKVFSFADLDNAYSEFWKDHRTKIELKRYSNEELDDLVKNAKNAGVSLTAYLITGLIKDADSAMDVGLAVDGRTDGNRSMGNQATGISVKYRYDKKKSFDDNARAVFKAMREKLDDSRSRYLVLQFMGLLDPTLKDSLNLVHAGCFESGIASKVADLLGYGDKVKDISITNLTRADIPLDYSDYHIREIVFVPPIVSYAKNVIGIVTTGNVMTVARHIYSA